jgi:signal transduction histidine kinase
MSDVVRASRRKRKAAADPPSASQLRLRRLLDSQIAARVQRTREEERAALARELHDELGQTLTAIKLELARAAAVLTADRLQPRAVDRLQSLVGLVDLSISTVKRITTELRPPTLDHLGLAEAIRWEAITIRARTGLRCRVDAATDGRRLSPEQQIVTFRIFQEALTNVVRHAGASAVRISLAERGDTFTLRVRDNGRGIRATQARDPGSVGLAGMRERAALIGGTVNVAGRRRAGTVVTVAVRLPHRRGAGAVARKRVRREQT